MYYFENIKQLLMEEPAFLLSLEEEDDEAKNNKVFGFNTESVSSTQGTE